MPLSLSRIRAFLSIILAIVPLLQAQESFNLEPFGNCNSLLSYYKENALERVESALSLGSPIVALDASLAATANVQAAPVPEAAVQPEAGTDFSDTNVQVAGVDEPDIIKTDGKRVFVLRGRTLNFVAVLNNGTTGKVVSSLTLPYAGTEMLLHKNNLLVIANDFVFAQPLFVRKPHRNHIDRAENRSFILPPQDVATYIFKISISEKTLRLDETLRLQGRYISARSAGGIARVITSFSPANEFFNGPRPVPFEEQVEIRKEFIRNTTLANWTPTFISSKGDCVENCDGSLSGSLARCDNTFRPSDGFGGFSLLTVMSLSFEGPLEPLGTESIVSDGEEIYSTASSLYVTTTRFRADIENDVGFIGSGYRTTFHKFRYSGQATEYVASGSVKGSVLNQFSMHERNGIFFVATTEGASWWNGRDTSRSKVNSFEVQNKALLEIGEVGNLGLGERIFAVRYIGSMAYVVTFRQVDPLYVIDISQPRQLSVTGELKIPGFSSYLHPISEGKILGVGRDATDEGVLTGAKVSLFDVSDPRRPQEAAVWIAPGGTTAAQFDHRAFLFWAPEKVAVLPLSVPGNGDGDGPFTGAVVLEIGHNNVTSRGKLSHVPCCGLNSRSPGILRNLVLGRTKLWSLSNSQLQVNNINSLSFLSKVQL